MTSAAIAVTLSARRRGERVQWAFMLISLVFVYTTIVNIIEQPEGIKIAAIFIVAIVISSLFSRVWRSTELRVERIELDDMAREFIRQAAKGTVRIITNRIDRGDALEYELKEKEKRTDNHIPPGEPILFFEVTPGDASEFSGVLKIRGETLIGFKSCGRNLRPCLTPSRRFCFSCAMKPANCHMSILVGVKAIRFRIC